MTPHTNGNGNASRNRWRLLLAWASLPAFLCFAYTILLLIPIKILTVKKTTILNAPLASGDDLFYELTYCKSRFWEKLQADIQYTFIGVRQDSGVPATFNIPGRAMGPLEAGCGIAVEALVVPPLPAGLYKIQMTRTYSINPLVPPETTIAWSPPFQITAPVTGSAIQSQELKGLLEAYQSLSRQMTALIVQNERLLETNRKLIEAVPSIQHP